MLSVTSTHCIAAWAIFLQAKQSLLTAVRTKLQVKEMKKGRGNSLTTRNIFLIYNLCLLLV